MAGRRVVSSETIVVDGLPQLQRALREADPALGRELKKSLRKAAVVVQQTARSNVQHKTGRHDPKVPPLAGSIRVAVGANSVSVYSNALHAGVQDQGGRVGRNQATLLRRADVSQYMTRAVQSKDESVEREIRQALDAALASLD